MLDTIKKVHMSTSKYWCGTLNFAETSKQKHVDLVSRLDSAFLKGRLTYYVIAYEIGKDTGNHHSQFYLEFKGKTRFTTVLKLVGSGAHIELRKGTSQQAADYIRDPSSYDKPKEFTLSVREKGNLSIAEQKKKTQTQEMVEALHKGATEKEIALKFTAQYLNRSVGIGKVVAFKSDAQSLLFSEKKMQAIALTGPTATGKTYTANQLCREAIRQGKRVYVKDPVTQWWDGYDGQEVVLINEFSSTTTGISLTTLLEITDTYYCTVPVRYKQSPIFKAEQIIFTSNTKVEDWYTSNPYFRDQIVRRIQEIRRTQRYEGPAAIESKQPSPPEATVKTACGLAGPVLPPGGNAGVPQSTNGGSPASSPMHLSLGGTQYELIL